MAGKRKKAPASRTRTASRKKPSAPKGPRDLRGEIRALRDTLLTGLSTRPGASSRERARQGAWDSILKQRAPEARRKLEDLMKPRRWVFGEADDDPGIALRPINVKRLEFSRLVVSRDCGGSKSWRRRVTPEPQCGSSASVPAR